MKTKSMTLAIALVVIALHCMPTANGQIIDYCSNSRFDTSDVFNNSQLSSSDVVFGTNIDWKGNSVTLHLLLYYPAKQFDAYTSRPLIVLIHGGGFVTGSYTAEKDDEKYFARKGFVAASVEYRLGWNNECTPNSTSMTDATYRGMQDVKAALRYLAANASAYKIDTGYIFLFGRSAGAVASLFTGFVNEDEYNSVCPGTTSRLGHLDNATNSLKNTFSIKGIASRSGAVPDTSFIKANETIPVLMFHGTADQTVPYGTDFPYNCTYDPVMQGSSEIQKRLNSLGEIYELDYQVGAGHGDVYDGEDTFFYHRLSHFFKRILCKTFREIIYEDVTLIQNASSRCNTLFSNIKNKTNVSCTGGSDGSITVGRSGGESPYQYTINSRAYQTGNLFSNLKAANYTATVKDGRTCTASIVTKIIDGKSPCPVNALKQEDIRLFSSSSGIKIFPNPSASFFNLTLETNRIQNVEVEVTDVYGRTAFHTKEIKKVHYVFGENLASGIYFVRIIHDTNIETIKVIKAK